MRSEVTFTSGRFRPVLPEDGQVNPGRYGAELAFWLCVQLAGAGVYTSYPEYEDWGWFLEYAGAEGGEYRLCCGNVDGSDSVWRCFLEPVGRGLFGKKRPDPEQAAPLTEALARVLEAETSVREIRWSDEEA